MAKPPAPSHSQPQHLLLETAAVALVTGVAAALRFVWLDQAPPGLYHDEAINGILALHILDGNRSLFFGEREGLFMYLLAASIRWLGPDVVSLRWVPAALGTATVPTVYLLARLLYGRRVAVLAAVLLATNLWPVVVSRTVFRANTLPLLETAACLALWLALRQSRPAARLALFAAAGGLLGTVTYTYIAGRLVPILLIGFLLLHLWWDRRPLRPVWGTLPLYLGTAGLVFAPLASFYLAHPEALFGRMGQVALGEGAAPAGLGDYLANAARVAGMFFISGDENWRHNFDARPVFDPILALAFTAGIVYCLRGWRSVANRFLLLWLSVMLVPTLAAADAPHYLRAIGAQPAVFILPALGLAWAIEQGQRRLPEAGRRGAILGGERGFALASALLLVLSTAYVGHTYFGAWLKDTRSFTAFNGHLAYAGRYLADSSAWRDSAAGRHDFYLSRHFWADRTTMLFSLWPWLSHEERVNLESTRLNSPWLDEERALPLRPEGASYLLSGDGAWAAEELRLLYGGERVAVEKPYTSPAGMEPLVVLSAPAEPRLADLGRPLAAFGGGLELLDYRLPSATPSGEEGDVVTLWRIGSVPADWRAAGDGLTVFVHILDSDGSPLATADGLGYHPIDWQTGELLALRHSIAVPPGTIPGTYQLLAGVVGPTGKRVAEGVQSHPDAAARMERPFSVGPAARWQEPPRLDHASELRLEEDWRLLGIRYAASPEVAPGTALTLDLYWRSLADAPNAYDVSLALVAADGTVWASSTAPAGGDLPAADRWRDGDLVRERRHLLLSAQARGGRYTLTVEAVRRDTGARLGPASLAKVEVREPPRRYSVPPMSHPLAAAANLGELAELLGADLGIVDDELRATVYWRGLATMDTRYKVFVHLVAPDGRIVGQSDAEPAAYGRPTTGWLPGEVILDAHRLPLSPDLRAGVYRLDIGLYGAEDGARLPVIVDGQRLDDKVTLAEIPITR